VPWAHNVVTGDWVVVNDARVHEVLERATAIIRPRPAGEPQVLAANVDLVGVVHGLDQPLNHRRLERGLVLAWESGAMPVVLLTKADLAEDVGQRVDEAATGALGVDVIAVSTVDGRGLNDLSAVLAPDKTLAVIGASGAGKSSLVNALLGSEHLDTQKVRASDGKGRHTTVRRELIALPQGGAVLDTLGLRALTIGGATEGVEQAFADVVELADGCRFSDCSHTTEPGCAVLEAVANGDLDADRYEGWRRIARELANAELRANVAEYRRRNRQFGRINRDATRLKESLR
jgi:ribosome biogenesis GTPase